MKQTPNAGPTAVSSEAAPIIGIPADAQALQRSRERPSREGTPELFGRSGPPVRWMPFYVRVRRIRMLGGDNLSRDEKRETFSR